MFNLSNLKQTVVAAAAAVVFTATAVGAAVGPAAENAPIAVAHVQIEGAAHA